MICYKGGSELLDFSVPLCFAFEACPVDKKQFSIRTALITTACLAFYFALAQRYGFGRAILCLANLILAASSLLFFATAYSSFKEENTRNAAAATLLGVLILSGALLVGLLLFQPIAKEPKDPFDSQSWLCPTSGQHCARTSLPRLYTA